MLQVKQHLYSLLPFTPESSRQENYYRLRYGSHHPWRVCSLVSLIINLLFITYLAINKGRILAPSTPFRILSNTPSRSVVYRHFSNYSSESGENSVEIASTWENINPDHGIVAISHDWAAEHNLLPAMDLPSNPTKGIYAIDSYHTIHCLMIIRRAFYILKSGGSYPFSHPLDHYSHCFDSIRQNVMCSASDHLFPALGDRRTGDGVSRECRNWPMLREWAAEHTACDMNDIHGKNDILHQELCHGPTDGILEEDFQDKENI